MFVGNGRRTYHYVVNVLFYLKLATCDLKSLYSCFEAVVNQLLAACAVEINRAVFAWCFPSAKQRIAGRAGIAEAFIDFQVVRKRLTYVNNLF